MKKVFLVLSFVSQLLACDYEDVDEAPVEHVSISGISRQGIVRGLYEIACSPLLSSGTLIKTSLTDDDLRNVDTWDEVDYLHGRVIKIYFCASDFLEVGQFNFWYGKGVAQKIIERLRQARAADSE